MSIDQTGQIGRWDPNEDDWATAQELGIIDAAITGPAGGINYDGGLECLGGGIGRNGDSINAINGPLEVATDTYTEDHEVDPPAFVPSTECWLDGYAYIDYTPVWDGEEPELEWYSPDNCSGDWCVKIRWRYGVRYDYAEVSNVYFWEDFPQRVMPYADVVSKVDMPGGRHSHGIWYWQPKSHRYNQTAGQEVADGVCSVFTVQENGYEVRDIGNEHSSRYADLEDDYPDDCYDGSPPNN